MLSDGEREKIKQLAASLGTYIDGGCNVAFWPYYLIDQLVKRIEELERRIQESYQER